MRGIVSGLVWRSCVSLSLVLSRDVRLTFLQLDADSNCSSLKRTADLHALAGFLLPS